VTLLLDTHIVFWWLVEPARVSERMRAVVQSASGAVHVSHVSLWELAVKRTTGKLRLDVARFAEQVTATGFEWLPISREHILACDALALRPDHRDPFDRLLVAQADVERARFVTADRALAGYGERVMVVA
jgi:PIN domain nuclease of toxin-antitoxin system